MARSVSFSTTLAEVTPYWEPALWVLIVVVTAGIVGSALWAPSRKGHRRGRRKLFRRSDAKVRREERTAVAATMVPAVVSTAPPATSDFYPEPDFGEDDVADDAHLPAAATAAPPHSAADAGTPAPQLYDQADDPVEAPRPPVAPTAPESAVVAAPEPEPVPSPAPVVHQPEVEPPAAAHGQDIAVAASPTVATNGHAAPDRPVDTVAEATHAPGAVAFADVEAGFARLAADAAVLGAQIGFFDERSNVPPEMPTWPIEHQQALAERAAEALADPLDELLEHSLAVASDVRALDRLLGGRFHDEDAAQAIVGTRIDLDTLRRHHGHIQRRFTTLAGDFAVLSGTAEQLAKVASIIDATDAVMASWQPTMVEAARTASSRS
jgi:hypothetical protein